jgi:hypothetical protein
MSHSDDFDFSSDFSGGESGWDQSSLPGGSNLGSSSQNNEPHRPEAPGSIRATNLHIENPPWPSAAYSISSTASTISTGSYLYTTCSGQGMSSILPRIANSALGQPTGTDSESSIDPILLRFASPAGQISGVDSNWTLSSGNIDSGDTGSGSGGPNSLEKHQTETPNTTETNHSEEDIFDLDQDPLDPLDPDLNSALFVGLEFPGEFNKLKVWSPIVDAIN